MKCEKCGSEIAYGSGFCGNCGTPVSNDNDIVSSSGVKSKNNKRPILVVIIVLLLCVALGLGGYTYFKKSSPKEIFTTSINKVFNSIDLRKISSQKANYKFGLSVNVKTNDIAFKDLLDIVNGISINGNLGIDSSNKEALLKIETKYNSKDLLSGNVYISNNKGYLYLNNLFNKYISTDEIDVDDLFVQNTNVDAYEKVIKSVKVAINNSLKDEYFSKEKEGDLTKYIFDLSALNSKKIVESIVFELKDNSDFIQGMKDALEISKDDVLEMLDSLKEDILEDGYDYKIVAYAKGTKFEKLEITSNSKKDVKVVITLNENKKYTISLHEDENTKYEFSVTVDKQTDGTNYIIETDIEGINLKVNVFYGVKYNEDIEKVNITNSVDVNDLTSNDLETIMENISENETLQELIDAISGIVGLPEDDDFGYDADFDFNNDYSFDTETENNDLNYNFNFNF